MLNEPFRSVAVSYTHLFLRTPDAGEAHEILDRVLIGAAGMGVAEVGEPFDLGRHVGEPVELGGGQEPVGGRDFGGQLGGGSVDRHRPIVVLGADICGA